MDWNRIKDDISILIFAAILAFTIVLSAAGMVNTVSKLDYRVNQGQQEIADAKR
jgi:hypothetical protein